MATLACSVCGAALPGGHPACGACGYPSSLAADAERALQLPDGVDGRARADPNTSPTAVHPARSRPAPEFAEPLVEELEREVAGLPRPDPATWEPAEQIRLAAIAQVEGRTTEAVAILRTAITRLRTEAKLSIETRLGELSGRQLALQNAGVGSIPNPSIDRARLALGSGRLAEAATALRAAEGEIERREVGLETLRSRLAEIDELVEASGQAGIAVGGVEELLRPIRALLARGGGGPEEIGSAVRATSELLERLRTDLNSTLSGQLGRSADVLGTYPVRHPEAQAARGLHAEAAERLRHGRFSEAATHLSRLGRAIDALPPPHAPPELPLSRPRTATAPPATPPAPKVTSESVLEKARALISRVRHLPHDRAVTQRAARDIQRATELLRHRKLEEADVVLVRLMETLDALAPAEAWEPS